MNNAELESLLNARLTVARLGELDVNAWWRTDGALGGEGAFVGPRVLPFTHSNARARITFAVASHACDERYPEQKAFHLFRLTPEIEDQLDDFLQGKLGQSEYWDQWTERLEGIRKGADVRSILNEWSIVTPDDFKSIEKLPLGPGGRSVAIPRQSDPLKLISLLAAGFIRSTPQQLVVPYTYGVGQG
jgi:hypothetical protein